MHHDTITTQLDVLRQAIAAHPQGIDAHALLRQTDLGLQQRTLQRRLALLVEQGHIGVQGKARAMRYVPMTSSTVVQASAPPPATPYAAQPYIPISPEAQAIQTYVRQPRHLRTPVAYRTEFLAAYHPNSTHYLPAKLRAFGFETIEVADGNDLEQVLSALNAPTVPSKRTQAPLPKTS